MTSVNNLAAAGVAVAGSDASVSDFSVSASSVSDSFSNIADSVAVLRITGAFGIAGLLRAVAFSDNLSSYRELYTEDGRGFTFRLVRYVEGRNIIIGLDKIKDRTQALDLKGMILYIQRKNLDKITAPNEYYVCDLIGKKVKIDEHDVLDCKVVSVRNFGAGDLIEISYQSDTFMVPFRKEYFPQDEIGENGELLMTFEAFCNFK